MPPIPAAKATRAPRYHTALLHPLIGDLRLYRVWPFPPSVGRQPLQVLHDGCELSLRLHTPAPATACPVHPVPRLRLGKGVFAARAQSAANLVSPRRLKLAHSVARLRHPHLLPALPILRQVARAPLPGRDRFHLPAR